MPVITIAGTNGKGSVAAYCTAILGAAGHRVGTFTSPHLRDYRERIRVHDAMVSSEARSDQTEVANEAIGRLSEQTSAAGTEWALGIEARSKALLSRWGAR